MRLSVLGSLVASLPALLVPATSSAAVHLVCEADQFQTYNAQKVDGEWKAYGFTDDRYSNPFTFEFRGSSESADVQIFIDGEPTQPPTGIYHSANLIFFTDLHFNESSISSWQYIFNMETGKLLGSQVNGFNTNFMGMSTQGLKGRTVPFSCTRIDA